MNRCTPFPLYFQPQAELWEYFIINSDMFGCDWRRADNNAYELVIVRKNTSPGMQGFFYTFPDLEEFSTNDLYEPHPTLPNHWKYHGRADNIIVFSNGEKLNPATVEGLIQSHPEVKGALVVGSGRFQPGLLVEPITQPQSENDERKFIEHLWPRVVRANDETVAHGRIDKDFIAVTAADKPFCRAGKGTVQRGATIANYSDDIDQLYQRAERSHGDLVPLNLNPETLTQSLMSLLTPHLRGIPPDEDTNFFSAGLDSLQVMNISRKLRSSLEVSGYPGATLPLVARGVYSNPTPQRLSRFLLNLIIQGPSGSSNQEEDEEKRAIGVVKTLQEKYTRNFETANISTRPEASHTAQTVLLTGSTGALGSHLLHHLIPNPSIRKVICLNRAEDGGVAQQIKSMNDRGLTPLPHEKVEFHHMQVAERKLGLSDDMYSRLLQETDRFIHCAWPVNFNLSTDTFEPQLQGVRHLCDFAAEASKRVVFLFVSSVATVDGWKPSGGSVPEERLENWQLPSNGYGRSKMIGSLILEDAAKACDFPAASVRVGQIAGPEHDIGGSWNRNEWLPSIIASSLYLSALPADLGRANRVDWVPIERVAGSLIEIAGMADALDADTMQHLGGYYHCVNPSSTTWQEIAPAVQDFYGNRIQQMISFEEWVARLENSQTGDDSADVVNPALKLISTFRSMIGDPTVEPVVFDMSRTKCKSPTMRRSTAITPDLMRHWCAQWGF